MNKLVNQWFISNSWKGYSQINPFCYFFVFGYMWRLSTFPLWVTNLLNVPLTADLSQSSRRDSFTSNSTLEFLNLPHWSATGGSTPRRGTLPSLTRWRTPSLSWVHLDRLWWGGGGRPKSETELGALDKGRTWGVGFLGSGWLSLKSYSSPQSKISTLHV